MTPLHHYAAMARYNRWMNEKLYALAAKLSDEERKRNLGAFFGSLHGTLNHLLLADRIWLGRFVGEASRFFPRDASGAVVPVKALSQELYADFEELSRERVKTDQDIAEYVATLTQADLDRTFEYSSMAGAAQSHALWWALSHFFNHQTHHRGQATTLFMQLGHDPGATDLLVMFRTEVPPAA
jgi:uncharacterized damage-inducible protein DinB